MMLKGVPAHHLVLVITLLAASMLLPTALRRIAAAAAGGSAREAAALIALGATVALGLWLFRCVTTADTSVPRGTGDAIELPPHHEWCRICQAPRPPRARHCTKCKVCVRKFDHHCPLVEPYESKSGPFPPAQRFIKHAQHTRVSF